MVVLTGPTGSEHINIGTVDEGYSLCVNATVVGGDLGQTGGTGFAAATRQQPGGPNTLPLTITRNTTNGEWQLKQSFARNNAEREIVITMSLKNTSGSSKSNVLLFRTADFDVDSAFDNYADRSFSGGTAWMRQSHAATLQGITHATTKAANVESFDMHIGRAFAGNGCGISGVTAPTALGDWVASVTYLWGSIANGATKTVKFVYRIQ